MEREKKADGNLEEGATLGAAAGDEKLKDGSSNTTNDVDEAQTQHDTTSKEMASIQDVFSFAKTQKIKVCLVGAIACALVSGLVFPAMAFYFATAFEDLAAPTDDEDAFMDTIREVSIIFMVLGVLVFISMTAQSTLSETAASEMTLLLQKEWFEALLRQDMAYFDAHKDVMGEAMLISTHGAKFKKGTGKKFADGFQYFVTVIGTTGYAFYASWRLSLAILAISPLLVASGYFVVKTTGSQTARSNASYATAGSIVSNAVASIRTVLALNATNKVLSSYKEATSSACRTAMGQLGWIGLANGSQMASFALTYVVVLSYGVYLLYDAVREDGCDPSGTIEGNDACDPGAVDIFGALMGISFGAAVMPQVSVSLEAFSNARSACVPALRAIRGETESDPKQNKADHHKTTMDEDTVLQKYTIDSSSDQGKKLASVTGQIMLRDVRFAYPTRKQATVFDGLTLEIPAGKTVALCGASGCGKSTIVQLLERFYDCDGGSITLDGHDVKDLNVKWLRQQISLVSQEPKLFALSIRDNIALGAGAEAGSVSQERIEEAARMANAHDFILSFPSGYDTQVGDVGSQLSGGQKQRIAIARALVRSPKILLLDESTSALDSESEATVQDALDHLMVNTNMTTVVIAHRLSTIRGADIIAVVADGRIAESGTHEELLSKRGRYFDLVEAQKASAGAYETTSETSDTDSMHGSRHSVSDDGFVPIDDATTGQTKTPLIQFRDVYFEYPARPDTQVFRGLNLTVNRNETLAIVGPSGSGKSSIIQLIECFYRPSKGKIEFNGVDMKEINVRWLRDQLGLVSQEPVLFNTSIEENIRYGCPGATREQVVEAAKQANAHKFISEFPEGYATQVGQGSALISGGQKQRIAIARALLKAPALLLLDEATSALDSESEKMVQEALDSITNRRDQACIVIAHRLSTIRSADRIAVVDDGKVRELGTHDELMALPNGRYRRLQTLQNLDSSRMDKKDKASKNTNHVDEEEKAMNSDGQDEEDVKPDPEVEKKLAERARLLGSEDTYYFMIGGVGAVLAGLFFPGLGYVFAYMTDLLYTAVEPCDTSVDAGCEDFWSSAADDMRERSLKVLGGFVAVLFSTFFGNVLLFWGFGSASERMNKRVRDAAFESLLRQEVGWFDVRSQGDLTSHLSDDAALLHAFAGEPIRTLVLNLASVFVGVVISFVYMWPFALMTLLILPFMAFGAEMEMRMYLGEDEGDDDQMEQHSPGTIVIETLTNMRTVASLTLERERADEYSKALHHSFPSITTSATKGGAAGLGQFVQMWGMSLMIFFGGWLLANYSTFSYREFLISMFGLLFALSGLGVAAQGAVNREKANAAASRIFSLIDRQSLIDPMSDTGKKNV